MTTEELETIIALATLASISDGLQDEAEQARVVEVARSLGLLAPETVIAQAMSGALTITTLAARLESPEAKRLAHDTATAVCHANGWINPSEGKFLHDLADALQLDTSANDDVIADINRAVGDHPVLSATPSLGVPVIPDATSDTATVAAAAAQLDEHILDQALLTASLELLPDRLANLGILPLQLRLVHHIGQRHGQQLDTQQVTDLVATFGLGAAAQVLEKVVRRAFGGIAGGLLGGLLGGGAGIASGAAVTFASTYALGHAADQYYAQGRSLSSTDLKALFTKFRADAVTIFPRVESRVSELARGKSLDGLLRTVTR
ncbi:TerB family tellurite resistance protein [Gemmatimonas groenlandica]|uniref:TerB family tellurite resistance protein n=1 Tax=Gemmatimonas groenlandica TaxID=2732249 RepID=A0A6M4IJK3_9BACT|nr:TerB family tellurite resistance protein [Gemmatimonas groenlandica]QJR34029.1 TerB family tellurite resistance protein [Gemmatimonas groenlandica]